MAKVFKWELVNVAWGVIMSNNAGYTNDIADVFRQAGVDYLKNGIAVSAEFAIMVEGVHLYLYLGHSFNGHPVVHVFGMYGRSNAVRLNCSVRVLDCERLMNARKRGVVVGHEHDAIQMPPHSVTSLCSAPALERKLEQVVLDLARPVRST